MIKKLLFLISVFYTIVSFSQTKDLFPPLPIDTYDVLKNDHIYTKFVLNQFDEDWFINLLNTVRGNPEMNRNGFLDIKDFYYNTSEESSSICSFDVNGCSWNYKSSQYISPSREHLYLTYTTAGHVAVTDSINEYYKDGNNGILLETVDQHVVSQTLNSTTTYYGNFSRACSTSSISSISFSPTTVCPGTIYVTLTASGGGATGGSVRWYRYNGSGYDYLGSGNPYSVYQSSSTSTKYRARWYASSTCYSYYTYKTVSFTVDNTSPTYGGYANVSGYQYYDGTSYWVKGGNVLTVDITHSDNVSVWRQYFGFNHNNCTPNNCGGAPDEIKSYTTMGSFADWLANDSYLNITNASVVGGAWGSTTITNRWSTTFASSCPDWDWYMYTYLYDWCSKGVGYTALGKWVKVDNTAPTHDEVTVNNSCWATYGSNTYTITIKSTEPRSGFGGSYGMMALVNYNLGEPLAGGYFAWHPTSYVHSDDQMACSGGGYVSKASTWGGARIDLVSATTSVSGSQRTVTFTVRPHSDYLERDGDNKISMYTSDNCSNNAGWTLFDVNFTTTRVPSAPTGATTICVGGSATLTRGNTPPTGVTYYWQTSPSGTSTSIGSGATLVVSPGSTTTYYLRPYSSSGCWGQASTGVTVSVVKLPTTANAGPDQTGASTCGLTTVTLAGNDPEIGTGSWSIVSGTGGGFANSSQHNTTFTGTAGSTYTLRWTISNSPCNSSSDDVVITFNQNPTTANAGPDQTGASTCGLTTVTLAGNDPEIGTGSWSIVSGTGGGFANSSQHNTTFTGTAGSTYTLRWTISNSPCNSSSDDVVITFNQNPTTANAGPDQTGASTCGLTTVTLAGNDPEIGTGSWSIVSGTGGGFANSSQHNTTFTGTAGSTYTLRWTISNSPCNSSSDDVVITFNQSPTPADAGTDQYICGTSTSLEANTPTIGIGTWSIVTGENGTISNTSNPSSTFTGVVGNVYTLKWTISNSICPDSEDYILISLNNNPSVSVTGASTICSGLTATLRAFGENPVGIMSYQWQYYNGDSWVDIGTNNHTLITQALTSTTNFRCLYNSTGIGCSSAISNEVTITVNTPNSSELVSDDYVWTGAISNDWNNPSNWIVFNGTDFYIPTVVPSTSNDVLFTTYGSNCGSSTPVISSAFGSCRNFDNESGHTVEMSNGQTLTVAGNWNNMGTFNAGNGKVLFSSNSQQHVNTNSSSFYNIEFNNNSISDASIIINDELFINGNAVFANGVVVFSGGGSLTFGSAATSSAGSATSYVDGPVAKQGISAFTFATGEGNIWAPVGIAAPGVNSTITAEYNFVPGPLNWTAAYMCNEDDMHHTSGIEHWELTTTSATPAVTLYWKDGTRSDITDLSDLSVAHWTGACWANKGGTVSGDLSVGSITSTIPFSSYSPITFGSKDNINPLPVELVYFRAICNVNQAELIWQTASEINNDRFVLQRSSDMQEWEDIANITGAGNSTELIDYSYTDRNPYFGNTYYRLIQTDFDGTNHYSDVIVVSCENDDSEPMLMVYPNPFKTSFFVEVNNWDTNILYIEMFDLLGKKVGEWTSSGIESHFKTEIDMREIKPSMYVIKARTANKVIVKKIEKN